MWWAPLLGALAGASQERQAGGSGQDALLGAGLNAVSPVAGQLYGGAKAAQQGNAAPLLSTGLDLAGLEGAADTVDAVSNPVGTGLNALGGAITGPGKQPGENSGKPISFEQEDGAPDGTGNYVYADGTKRYVAGQGVDELYKELVQGGQVTQAGTAEPSLEQTPAEASANAEQVKQDVDLSTPIQAQGQEEQALLGLNEQKQAVMRSAAEAQVAQQQQRAARINELVEDRVAQTAAEKIAADREIQSAKEDQKWAEDRVKQITDEKIDPLRLWNDAGFFGKAVSALLLLTAQPHNLRILMPFVGGLIQGDIAAQKFDKTSQLNAYQGLLGDSRSAEKAGELKRYNALKDAFEAKLKGVNDPAMQQGAAQVMAELDQRIVDGNMQLTETVFNGRRNRRMADEARAIQERKLAQQDRALGQGDARLRLERERMKMANVAKSPTASDMLKDIEAKLALKEISETGRTPAQNKEARVEAKELTDKLTPVLGVQVALDELSSAAGLYRNEKGELAESGDVPGKGPGEGLPVYGGMISALKGNRQARIKLESALMAAKDSLLRLQSGGAATEDEVAMYTEMLDARLEEDFVNKLNQVDKFIRGRADAIKTRASDSGLEQWLQNFKRENKQPAGRRKVEPTEIIGPTGALDPRDESRRLYEQMYGMPV